MTKQPCPFCGGEEFDRALKASEGDPDAKNHFLRLAQRKTEYDQHIEKLHAQNELLTDQMNYYAHQAAWHRARLRTKRNPTKPQIDKAFNELEQAYKARGIARH